MKALSCNIFIIFLTLRPEITRKNLIIFLPGKICDQLYWFSTQTQTCTVVGIQSMEKSTHNKTLQIMGAKLSELSVFAIRNKFFS